MVKTPYFEIIKNEAAGEPATILIYDIIGGDFFDDGTNAKDFVNQFNDLQKTASLINIRLNSPGGSVWEGLPIVNAILQSKVDVHSYIDGIAYSMGAIIALAAKKVHIANNGTLMLHNAMGRVSGNSKELRSYAEYLDLMDDSLISTVAKKLSKTADEIKDLFFDHKDHFYSAKEAKDLGLVDEIIGAAEGVTNFKGKNYKDIINQFSTSDKNNIEMSTNKFAGLVALVSAFQSVSDVTDALILDAQNALNEANSGLVLVKDTELRNLKASNQKLIEQQANTDALVALFGDDAKADGFDLNASIANAIKVAKAKGAADGENHQRQEDNSGENEKPENPYANMEHHQKADRAVRI